MTYSQAVTHSYKGIYESVGAPSGPAQIAEIQPPYARPQSPARGRGEADWTGPNRAATDQTAAAQAFSAFTRLSRARASVLVHQCRLLLQMHKQKLFHQHGYRNLGDFAQEVLKIAPRTAGRRLTVAKVLATHRRAERAFLSGQLSLCQIETLAPVLTADRCDFDAWLRAAETHSIKELRRQVKAAAAPDHRSPPQVRLQIRAPLSAAQAFDHALHAARHVLGWDAPRTECFEAILAEAESSMHHAVCPRTPEIMHERYLARAASLRAEPVAQANRATTTQDTTGSTTRELVHFLSVLDRELNDLEALCHDEPPDPVMHFRLLEQSLRPLALLESRLLLRLRAALTPNHFHQATWEDVARHTFRMSVRRFRDLIRDAKLLHRWKMEDVYVEGTLSLSHLRLITRLEGGPQELEAWLERAQHVTFRQLAREIDVAEKLTHLREPTSWPYPAATNQSHDPAGEPTPQQFHYPAGEPTPQQFRDPAEAPAPQQFHDPPGESAPDPTLDPAVDPRILERMERYVHARLMQEFPAGVSGQTLASFGPTVAITVHVSPEVLEQWHRLRDAVQACMGERAPAWVCLVQILHLALTEWSLEEQDPKTLAQRIVQRDDYHCTAPGCSQRRHLEAHHIVFQSRGGGDHPQNLTTLCAFHHRFGIHGQVMQLSGQARQNLHWRFPSGRYHGNLRLA